MQPIKTIIQNHRRKHLKQQWVKSVCYKVLAVKCAALNTHLLWWWMTSTINELRSSVTRLMDLCRKKKCLKVAQFAVLKANRTPTTQELDPAPHLWPITRWWRSSRITLTKQLCSNDPAHPLAPRWQNWFISNCVTFPHNKHATAVHAMQVWAIASMQKNLFCLNAEQTEEGEEEAASRKNCSENCLTASIMSGMSTCLTHVTHKHGQDSQGCWWRLWLSRHWHCVHRHRTKQAFPLMAMITGWQDHKTKHTHTLAQHRSIDNNAPLPPSCLDKVQCGCGRAAGDLRGD